MQTICQEITQGESKAKAHEKSFFSRSKMGKTKPRMLSELFGGRMGWGKVDSAEVGC